MLVFSLKILTNPFVSIIIISLQSILHSLGLVGAQFRFWIIHSFHAAVDSKIIINWIEDNQLKNPIKPMIRFSA